MANLHKLQSILSIYAMSALLSSTDNPKVREDRPLVKPKTKASFKYRFVIPKGALLYLFDQSGVFETFETFASRDEMPSYSIFWTIARSKEMALQKFKQFQKTL